MTKTDDTPRDPPPAWIDALEESRADLAAGRIVDGETVHRKIRESLARMEARRAAAE